MTLLTAFAVLLSRYSGQQDVVIGTPIAVAHDRKDWAASRMVANRADRGWRPEDRPIRD